MRAPQYTITSQYILEKFDPLYNKMSSCTDSTNNTLIDKLFGLFIYINTLFFGLKI